MIKTDEMYAASSLTRRDGTKMLIGDYRTFKIHPIDFHNVRLCHWMRGVCISGLRMAAAVDGQATKTRAIDLKQWLQHPKGLSLSFSRTLHFFSSRTARDQIHTQQSKGLSCRVSHVNTVGYGLSEYRMCVSITCIPSILKRQCS